MVNKAAYFEVESLVLKTDFDCCKTLTCFIGLSGKFGSAFLLACRTWQDPYRQNSFTLRAYLLGGTPSFH